MKIDQLSSKALSAWKRVLVACSCARLLGEDVLGEVKGIDVMGVLVAGMGARFWLQG